MKKTFVLAFIFSFSGLVAQKHLSPPSGADGVPGRIPGSFAVAWEAVEGAIAYGFVLTDNSNCFQGCAGDTRQGRITDTRTIQFGLQEGIFYYWITRIYYANGDSSGWSPISNFRAITADIGEIISVESPATDQSVVWIDWQGITDVLEIKLRIIDLQGRQWHPNLAGFQLGLRPRNGFERFSRYEIPLTGVRAGVYILVFALQRAEGEERQVKKLVVR